MQQPKKPFVKPALREEATLEGLTLISCPPGEVPDVDIFGNPFCRPTQGQ